jgi:hypothetical protein
MHNILQRTQEAIEQAVQGMNSEQLAWHAEGKWSAAEILEHLSLTYKGTAKNLERCLAAGWPKARAASWRERVATFLVTRLRYMPKGRQSPAPVLPRGLAPSLVVVEARGQLAAADAAISSAEARFGAGTKIANHPILGPLSARQWRTFHLVHARHHMKQVARIRRQIAAAR